VSENREVAQKVGPIDPDDRILMTGDPLEFSCKEVWRESSDDRPRSLPW
jgi:hypothetical protein